MESIIQTLVKYYELTYAISFDSFQAPCGRDGGFQLYPLNDTKIQKVNENN